MFEHAISPRAVLGRDQYDDNDERRRSSPEVE
jgi:hypothetical protein